MAPKVNKGKRSAASGATADTTALATSLETQQQEIRALHDTISSLTAVVAQIGAQASAGKRSEGMGGGDKLHDALHKTLSDFVAKNPTYNKPISIAALTNICRQAGLTVDTAYNENTNTATIDNLPTEKVGCTSWLNNSKKYLYVLEKYFQHLLQGDITPKFHPTKLTDIPTDRVSFVSGANQWPRPPAQRGDPFSKFDAFQASDELRKMRDEHANIAKQHEFAQLYCTATNLYDLLHNILCLVHVVDTPVEVTKNLLLQGELVCRTLQAVFERQLAVKIFASKNKEAKIALQAYTEQDQPERVGEEAPEMYQKIQKMVAEAAIKHAKDEIKDARKRRPDGRFPAHDNAGKRNK